MLEFPLSSVRVWLWVLGWGGSPRAFLAELPHTVPVSAPGLVIHIQTQPIVQSTQLYSWEEQARELLSCSSLRQLLQTTAERSVLVRGCAWRLLQAAPHKLFRKTLILSKEGN